jgi:translocator protein
MKYLSCIVFIIIMLSAALPAALFPPGDWYASLNKPSWNPPSYLFGPIWTSLYVLIGIAGWRVWLARKQEWADQAIVIWIAQWLLNAAWSLLFFGMKSPAIATLECAVLLGLIVAFILKTKQQDRIAMILFVPYALWVSFATFLTGTLWFLNA